MYILRNHGKISVTDDDVRMNIRISRDECIDALRAVAGGGIRGEDKEVASRVVGVEAVGNPRLATLTYRSKCENMVLGDKSRYALVYHYFSAFVGAHFS